MMVAMAHFDHVLVLPHSLGFLTFVVVVHGDGPLIFGDVRLFPFIRGLLLKVVQLGSFADLVLVATVSFGFNFGHPRT